MNDLDNDMINFNKFLKDNVLMINFLEENMVSASAGAVLKSFVKQAYFTALRDVYSDVLCVDKELIETGEK